MHQSMMVQMCHTSRNLYHRFMNSLSTYQACETCNNDQTAEMPQDKQQRSPADSSVSNAHRAFRIPLQVPSPERTTVTM